MIEQGKSAGRDPRIGQILTGAFATTAGRNAPYTIPTPLLYQNEKDFPAVLSVYQNRGHIAKNMGLLFLAPKTVRTEEERMSRWSSLLAEVNADFYIPVLVDTPDVARMIAARLRNSGSSGLSNLFLQTTPRGMRAPLAPVTRPQENKTSDLVTRPSPI